MPVGRWVRRTAESVLLTCWPPAPLARYVSTRSSFSSISTAASSGTSGMTSTSAKLVCRRFCESYGLIRTSRCTPRSLRSRPYAQRPSMLKLTLLSPASSPSVASRISVLNRLPLAPSAGTCAAASRPSPGSRCRRRRHGSRRSRRARRTARDRRSCCSMRSPVGLERGEVALEVGLEARGLRPAPRRPSRPSRPGRTRARSSDASLDLGAQLLGAAHGGLRRGGVVPQVGVGRALGQLGELGLVVA